jgi:hypothetical protein
VTDELVAPDFAEPLLGWRSWRAVEQPDGRVALTSVVHGVHWPARRELVADCLRQKWEWWPRRHAGREHRTPETKCGCGIYGVATVTQALDYLESGHGLVRRPLPAVLGIVKLWGRVLECERGWRAAFAYPARLFVVPSRARGSETRRLAEGLGRYGVPVDVLDRPGGSVIDLLAARDVLVEFSTPPLPRGR